jgi:hypothetical protein
MSVGSAQTAKKRQEKLDQEISNELDSVSAKDDGDGLAAEDVQTAADCERLNDLELGPNRRIPIIANGWGSGVVVSPEHPRPSGVGPGIGPTTRRSAWCRVCSSHATCRAYGCRTGSYRLRVLLFCTTWPMSM